MLSFGLEHQLEAHVCGPTPSFFPLAQFPFQCPTAGRGPRSGRIWPGNPTQPALGRIKLRHQFDSMLVAVKARSVFSRDQDLVR